MLFFVRQRAVSPRRIHATMRLLTSGDTSKRPAKATSTTLTTLLPLPASLPLVNARRQLRQVDQPNTCRLLTFMGFAADGTPLDKDMFVARQRRVARKEKRV